MCSTPQPTIHIKILSMCSLVEISLPPTMNIWWIHSWEQCPSCSSSEVLFLLETTDDKIILFPVLASQVCRLSSHIQECELTTVCLPSVNSQQYAFAKEESALACSTFAPRQPSLIPGPLPTPQEHYSTTHTVFMTLSVSDNLQHHCWAGAAQASLGKR